MHAHTSPLFFPSYHSFALLNAGDGIMIPTPYYGGYDPDFVKVPQAVIVPVVRSADNNYQLTTAILEEAWEAARASGTRVRALLVTNPDNPTGIMMTRESIGAAIAFVKTHKIHLLVNEMYFLSIHDPSAQSKHISIFSLPDSDLPDRSYVHFLWGYSKTFGMSGFRVGCVYTLCEPLLKSLQQTAYFTSVGGLTQHHLGQLFADLPWVHSYLSEINARLRKSYELVVSALRELQVPYVAGEAGFFVWVNYSSYLSEHTLAGELALWHCLLAHGVNLSPGAAFHSAQAHVSAGQCSHAPTASMLVLIRLMNHLRNQTADQESRLPGLCRCLL